jgi:hemoglobin-like flavoprotein
VTINLRRITIVAACLATCCASASFAVAQQQQQQQQPAPVVNILAAIKYNGDMAALLDRMAEAYGTTIGLEVDPEQPKSIVKLELREATLQDVLNAIVQSEPRYQWRENDGFIDVFPVKGSSPLLETKISSFRVNDVDQTEAINQLMNSSEVLVGMNEMNLSRRDFSRASVRGKGEKFSMSLEGVTLRRALHKIAKESGGRFWISRRYGNKAEGQFFSVSDSVR